MSTYPDPAARSDVASRQVDARPAGGEPRQKRSILHSLEGARQIVGASGRRTCDGEGGLAELAALVELQHECDTALDVMVRHLLQNETCSYREIATALGVSRQAVAARWPGVSGRPAGGQEAGLR